MEDVDVVVIGGGAAGLAAATFIASHNRSVVILEARERLGGRMHTVPIATEGRMVELGAEFIHGSSNATWDTLRTASLGTIKVPNRHYMTTPEGNLQPAEFQKELKTVMDRLQQSINDQSFASFLQDLSGISTQARAAAMLHVEGFHAANADRIGVRALQRSESASEQNGGEDHYWVEGGYKNLVNWYSSELCRLDVRVELETRARQVLWNPGEVQVAAERKGNGVEWRAKAAVVTLPLGVLQETAGEMFRPRLGEKEEAINGLAMGDVIKLQLKFRSRFWPEANFGFIHAKDEPFPTFWSHEDDPILTAWAGGGQVTRLSTPEDSHSPQAAAISALARIFKHPEAKIAQELSYCATHDWGSDPFSRGAYSYTPAGMVEMPELLAAPVAGTLFFAGEATEAEGNQGTVHGAIASGNRAAAELLDSI